MVPPLKRGAKHGRPSRDWKTTAGVANSRHGVGDWRQGVVSLRPGVVNSLAYNLIFIASVSTLLANLSPLLKFDGYYILCDLVDLPNLSQRAGRLWRHWAERYAEFLQSDRAGSADE